MLCSPSQAETQGSSARVEQRSLRVQPFLDARSDRTQRARQGQRPDDRDEAEAASTRRLTFESEDLQRECVIPVHVLESVALNLVRRSLTPVEPKTSFSRSYRDMILTSGPITGRTSAWTTVERKPRD